MTQVFREHAPVVYGVAVRTAQGDRGAAEDAVQRAFVEAFKAWPTFREWPPGLQRSFLCERARNRVIDGWRTVRDIVPTETVPEERVSRSAEDIVLSKIALERCLKVISSMSERAKRVAFLVWHEEWTMTETARHLGISRTTVFRELRAVAAAVKEQVGDEIPFPLSDDDGEEA